MSSQLSRRVYNHSIYIHKNLNQIKTNIQQYACFFVIIITKYALMKNMRKYCKWFHLYFALSILSYIEMIIPIKVHIICSCSIRCSIIKNDVFAITTQGQVIPMSLKLIPNGKIPHVF